MGAASRPSQKIARKELDELAPEVVFFLERMTLAQADIDVLQRQLMDYVRSNNLIGLVAQEEAFFNISCEWVLANRESTGESGLVPWGTWVMSAEQCQAGTSWQASTASCIKCPAGRTARGGAACRPCPAGTYCPAEGTGQPSACPPGSYCPEGSIFPVECGAGTFSARAGAGGASSCQPCGPGTHMALAGASACEECPAGKARAQHGGAECRLCPAGAYSSRAGSSACSPCPADTTTNLLGAANLSSCICEEGLYGSPASTAEESRCASCSILTTSAVGSSSGSDCYLSTAGVLVIAIGIFVLLASVGACLLVRCLRRKYDALKNKVLQERLTAGLGAVKNLAHPMVLISAQHFCDLSLTAMKNLHEGCRNAGYLITLDAVEAIEEFKRQGMMIVFFSYQWLSFDSPGPNDIQHERMQDSLQRLCQAQGLKWNNVFVWIDILSIPQCNDSLKSLAVNSLYTYAGQADWLVIIAPASEHENLKHVANAESYKRRVWCRAEQMAFFCFRGVDRMYLVTDSLEKVSDTWIRDVACIFDGDMTCCTLQHAGGACCDRTSLVPPLTGMYFDLYTKHKMGSLDDNGQCVWEFISHHKDMVFPAKYDYVMAERKPRRMELFGDLIERIERFVDADTDAALAMSTLKLKDARVSASHAAHKNKKILVSAVAPRETEDLQEAHEV